MSTTALTHVHRPGSSGVAKSWSMSRRGPTAWTTLRPMQDAQFCGGDPNQGYAPVGIDRGSKLNEADRAIVQQRPVRQIPRARGKLQGVAQR